MYPTVNQLSTELFMLHRASLREDESLHIGKKPCFLQSLILLQLIAPAMQLDVVCICHGGTAPV